MNTVQVIARLTLREAVRRKIVIAALVLGIAFLLFYGTGFYFMQRDYNSAQYQQRVMNAERFKNQAFNFFLMAGMYVVNFLGIATAALISADSLAGEIQSGTIQAIVTKPIRRSGVVLGKWLGHAILLLMYLLMMGGGVALVVKLVANYDPNGWLSALALMYFNSLVIMTLTMAFSSSMSTLATGGAVFGAYGLAFLGGWLERIGALLQNDTATNLGIFSSLLLPTEAIWNKATTYLATPLINFVGLNPFSSSSEPSPLMMIYAGLYLLALLWVALAQFQKRDL